MGRHSMRDGGVLSSDKLSLTAEKNPKNLLPLRRRMSYPPCYTKTKKLKKRPKIMKNKSRQTRLRHRFFYPHFPAGSATSAVPYSAIGYSQALASPPANFGLITSVTVFPGLSRFVPLYF